VMMSWTVYSIIFQLEYTWGPCWRSNCETYTCHCQGCEKNRSQGGKEGDFWNRLCWSFCHSSSRLLELGSDFSVSLRPLPWGRGLLECPTRLLLLSQKLRPSSGFLRRRPPSWKAVIVWKTLPKRDLCPDWLLEGDAVWVSPWEC
jgi:hypothetical protein